MDDILGHEEREALLRILQHSITLIRAFGWQKRPDQCANEADHIQNIPSMLMYSTLDRLKYYMDIEVRLYVLKAGDWSTDYEPFWAVLRSRILSLSEADD
ncbi:MAG: hypothetical protein V4719_15960 [Planctomycetota bacterium]